MSSARAMTRPGTVHTTARLTPTVTNASHRMSRPPDEILQSASGRRGRRGRCRRRGRVPRWQPVVDRECDGMREVVGTGVGQPDADVAGAAGPNVHRAGHDAEVGPVVLYRRRVVVVAPVGAVDAEPADEGQDDQPGVAALLEPTGARRRRRTGMRRRARRSVRGRRRRERVPANRTLATLPARQPILAWQT